MNIFKVKQSAIFLIIFFLKATSGAIEYNQPVSEISQYTEKLINQNHTEIERRENLRILYYKPIYFIYGEPTTKVQFSFRAPLAEGVPIFYAYSQIIFWKLSQTSKPFSDVTYNPEFFYRLSTNWPSLKTIDVGFWEHNSNGKSGIESRSYNQSYLRFNYSVEKLKWITYFSLKFRIFYNIEDSIEDLRDYVGPLEIQARLIHLLDPWLDETELTLGFTPGGKYAEQWDQGGYSIGLNFRMGKIKIIPAVYVQYFHGYSETLLNYDKRVDELRIGFLF